MKKIVLLAFVLVLLSTAVAVRFVRPVVADGTIYIKADGSVEGTAHITSVDNVTYTFTNNINDPIVVERDNIVVYGAGYTLQGTGIEKGIDLSERTNVTIRKMEIKEFFFGIYLNSSRNNIITGNSITNNLNGIYLSESSNNKFYHNNFIGNLKQVSSYNSTNVWDDGYPSGGNYWSNYTGGDVKSGPNQDQNSSDGVGDIPHVIDANNKDNYPLMNPWSNPQPSYTLTIHSSPTGVTFTVGNASHTTPWSGIYDKNYLVNLMMPGTHNIGDAKYYWKQWSDGNTNRLRTLTMTKNITLTANYTGPYYELTVTSSRIPGITFTVNGTQKTTPYTEWLPKSSYTIIEMPETHDGYVWSHWLEDGDPNRTRTVTMDKKISLTSVFTLSDTTPPTISILSPEDKTYPVKDVPLTFTVSESTSWVGYSLDNQANKTTTGNTTLSLPDGMHYVIVYANDTAGNMGASSMVYFTVDTAYPNIEILSPENKTYPVDNVPLTFIVDEATSWTGYSLDGQMNATASGNTTLVGLSDGVHTIIVYANDTDGNMGHSDTVHFTVNTAYPNIEILSPENKTYAVTDVPLTFTVSESTSWIGYSLDGQINETVSGNTTLVGLSGGTHTITVYANDTDGNMGSSGIVHFTMATLPSISILSPQNKTYDATDIPLTFTVDETVSWTAYSLDGQANVTIITGNITLTGLSDGSHSIIVYAKNTAGNTGASEIVYFTIETRQADPSQLWIVAVIAITAVVGFAVCGYMLYDLFKTSTQHESRHS